MLIIQILYTNAYNGVRPLPIHIFAATHTFNFVPISTTPTSNSAPNSAIQPSPHIASVPVASEPSIPLPTRASTRLKRSPSYLQDYHCNTKSCCTNQLSTNIVHPLSHVLSYNVCSPTYKLFFCSISSNIKPKTYNQVSKFDY